MTDCIFNIERTKSPEKPHPIKKREKREVTGFENRADFPTHHLYLYFLFFFVWDRREGH